MNLPKSLRTERLAFTLFALCCLLTSSMIYADPDLISEFSLAHYDQTVSNWIKPSDPDYDRALLTPESQLARLSLFYNRYYGSSSPWSAEYVNHIIQEPAPYDLKNLEKAIIGDFSNENKSGTALNYAENYRPHTKVWIDDIANNVNLSQFEMPAYQASQRGIAIDNLAARALPTDDVSFYSYKIAGQGYPFDNLQMSALWAGTPVYILGESRDHAWLLVITPDYVAWVKAAGIVRVDNRFVQHYANAAKDKMAAITRTKTSLMDQHDHILLSAYVGTVFPATEVGNHIKLMVPAASDDHRAIIKYVDVTKDNAAIMPLPATPHQFANLMNTLIGRPYGWGGMYFYNDCSAELKSLFTPFGIWLPRHSSEQMAVGKMADLSSASKDERIRYLKNNGRKFISLIYIGGHVVLYIGNYQNPYGAETMAMTYQDMWGLSPKPAIRRAVIGQSALFPLLADYPEDRTLVSQAAKRYFQVAYLDELPNEGNLLTIMPMTLKSLMDPNQTD